MKWTGLNELRERYLAFFESKAHLRLPSFSLVPQGDKSLLLINSGMAPMKKYFSGELTPPNRRVTTCQKCIRTPDIERVGKTARHGTYFEMLGNFSFGDYFKREACGWAWEFATDVMEMPVERLYVSVYLDDDEAYDIWTKEIGVDPARMVRLGKADNFWEIGTGPCGPCSEIYYDRGAEHGCGSPDCAPGCDCDRYVEFWNLVFTQFDSDGNGSYTPLASPNIDTGMGLERLACISQGVNNLFEVDTVRKIMGHVSEIAGVTYGADEAADISLRVITDHIRSTTFMLGDGVMPSNEGRGYVVRRLLRRAARHGRLRGIREPFLYKVCETVIAENPSYPELREKQELIVKLIRVEEESFGKTIDAGLTLLEEMLGQLPGKVLPGGDAFKLYDTYGFPLDLTRDILEERGLSVDEDAFNSLMSEQRERARAARKNAGAEGWKGGIEALGNLPASRFTGYQQFSSPARVTALVADNQQVTSVSDGDTALVVLDTTPFYAESGGQTGDIGQLVSESVIFEVQNTFKTAGGLTVHSGEVRQGTLTSGDEITAAADESFRLSVMRNHTAAHLIQAALRQVLGSHVEQAGQLVNEKVMRFDFTHFSALTAEEMAAVEGLVNRWILAGIDTDIREMPIEEAKQLGAMALFGEKYGDVVRVVQVPGVSMELCGGTHVDNTAKTGLFRILSESSVAAGVRRIEAVTGENFLQLIYHQKQLMTEAAEAMKASNPEDIARRAAQLTAELKTAQRTCEELKSKIAASQVDGLLDQAVTVGNILVVKAAVDAGGDTSRIMDALRAMCDRLRDLAGERALAAVLAGVMPGASGQPGSVSFACCCSPAAVAAGAHAGNIVRAVAEICGGRGGGRPDSAMAGGKDAAKVGEALAAVDGIVGGMLK
ncbi:MAG: alanine--tRNA ligase [Oscillospiraceae bacterium]|nr:alanine--tRNA ligase [Oscillospiraceae bacterium]